MQILLMLFISLFIFSCEQDEIEPFSEYSTLLLRDDSGDYRLFRTSYDIDSNSIEYIYNITDVNYDNFEDYCEDWYWYYNYDTGDWDQYCYWWRESCSESVSYVYEGHKISIYNEENNEILYENLIQFPDSLQFSDNDSTNINSFYDSYTTDCNYWSEGQYSTTNCGNMELDCFEYIDIDEYSTALIEIDNLNNFLYYSSGINSEEIQILDISGYQIVYSNSGASSSFVP